ncbi:DUF488 family protein [Streptomyces sp. SID4934]|uniref:DUF488 family protein n=1 Tax=Streptomyces albidoflavus TaxID=1886 RepID=A0ABY3GUW9_9ACTN|nr:MULTISPECIES: DUF488 family protein [Streptomyces]MYQ71820.1 DUF488 family protein [Streptomyces sp. SID4934]TWV22044.1 DUF488 family protein [Streptomyces albidoflavus]SCD85898.1 Uncharacterized conserved protein YeaO, DUF488 family [Streptomyces sp. ScaeMP-6W]
MSDETPRVRRVYEPAEPSDGTRVLVDRLWPRGVSKERAAVDVWLKEITPSTELRDWYHQNPEERYDGFTERYRTELADPAHRAAVGQLLDLMDQGTVTLITAVKEIDRSQLPVLVEHLHHLRRGPGKHENPS